MMVGCLYLLYLVHLVAGYQLDDVEDVPLPPSYLEQQQQWQGQPMQYSNDNYIESYAQAGNPEPNSNYEQQEYEEQYPRMAAASAEEPVNEAPPQTVEQPVVPPVIQPVSDTKSYAEPGHVVPQYIPPKPKPGKDEDPFFAPQWKNDEGIADGRNPKIVAALEAITADLIDRGKQLTAERHWTKQVESMLELYQQKVANVHAHSEEIREEMKTLLKKKRQIENVEVQDELNSKLRMAQGDLEALDGAMSHVQSKADEFAEKKKKLEDQIKKINSHIKNLQGKGTVSEDEESDVSSGVKDEETTTEGTALKADTEKTEKAEKKPEDDEDATPKEATKDAAKKEDAVIKKEDAVTKKEDAVTKKEDDEDKPAADTPKGSSSTEPKFRSSSHKVHKKHSTLLRGGSALTPKKVELDDE